MTDFDNFENGQISNDADSNADKRQKDKTVFDGDKKPYQIEQDKGNGSEFNFFSETTTKNVSSDTTKVATKKSGGGEAGVWIFTLLILAVFIGLILWAGSSTTPQVFGSITGASDFRYGQENEYKLIVTNPYNAEGKQVVWYLDGQEVFSAEYGHDAMTLQLSALNAGVGQHEIKVNIGEQEVSKFSFEVQKPLLTVSMPQVEVQYGQEIPSMVVTAEGWVDSDTAESVGFDNKINFSHTGQPAVGQYQMFWEAGQIDKYDIEVVGDAVLTVSPKTLTFENTQFAKVYDGNTLANAQQLKLSGIVGGDDINANVVVEFSDKNAGENKSVKITSCELTGESKDNYVLDFESVQFVGTITPLQITIDGIKANDKVFDGTTTVTFASSGDLSGILASDNVNVGEISARFEDSKRGYNKKIVIDKITLVGEDSANYCADCGDIFADIVGKRTSAVPSN